MDVRLGFITLVVAEEIVNVFEAKSAVTAVTKSVGLEQPVVTPLPDGVGMYMEKVSCLRNR